MKVEVVSIKDIRENPNNPRFIKDNKFNRLVKSVKDFPEMLKVRPIVVDEDNIILGGNMRYKAMLELKMKEVNIVRLTGITDQQKQEFIVKDNVGFGEWDWDVLANEWDHELLSEWGLDAIKNDWNDLEYIDEEIADPELKSKNDITISLPSELQNDRANIVDEIKDFLDLKWRGCEIQ
jgi:hypothetical protein|tara:strand:- start:40 stop:576 length:537 start_codon:yes stop_codon:yes gene_type:complete